MSRFDGRMSPVRRAGGEDAERFMLSVLRGLYRDVETMRCTWCDFFVKAPFMEGLLGGACEGKFHAETPEVGSLAIVGEHHFEPAQWPSLQLMLVDDGAPLLWWRLYDLRGYNNKRKWGWRYNISRDDEGKTIRIPYAWKKIPASDIIATGEFDKKSGEVISRYQGGLFG